MTDSSRAVDRSDSQSSTAFVLPALMFLSGVSVLIYEVVWTKYLALTFGSDLRAVSIVAAIFMGGLAAGSYLFGRVADRHPNPLRLYGLLEIGIAAGAIAFLPALDLAQRGYLAAARIAPESPLYIAVLQLSLAALLLLLPTLCMGGTLPVACRCFSRAGLSRWSGRLYGWNTAGAALGCLGAAFVLLPRLGLVAGGWLAVGGNLAAAGAALAMARGQRLHASALPGAPSPASIPRARSLLGAAALAGACAMALEILWTRVFLLFFGTTVYSFALVLGCYLAGLAAGGLLYARLLHKAEDRRTLFNRLLLLMGGSVLLTAPFYDRIAPLVLQIHRVAGDNWYLLSLLSLVTVFAVLCLPTLLSGALFPAAVGAIHPGSAAAGRTVGLLLLCNTLGAMAGSLAASFLLLPRLGLLSSFRLLGSLLVLAALLAHLPGRRLLLRPSGTGFLAVCAIALAGALVPMEWDQKTMNSGIYVYAPRILEEGGLRPYLGRTRLLFSSEGVEASVAVTQTRDGHRTLHVNGKADANSETDMPTQVLLGQLPLLLHPDPLEVLVIGLGSGVSAGAAATHPVRELRIAELSPAVVRAADFFADENRRVLSDPRTALFLGDGRSFLATRDRLYDVIVSEPSNPWQSGNANLFTAEFYRLAASRLAPGGLLCQWLPSYDLSLPNLRSAVATFLDTFPFAHAFWVYGDLILVGGLDPIPLSNFRPDLFFTGTETGRQLNGIGISSPQDLLSRHYLFDEQGLRLFAEGSPLNTDRRPRLEFAARDLRHLSDRAADTGAQTLSVLRRIGRELSP